MVLIDEDLVLYLYNGLLDHERRIVDAACGGSILNMTPTDSHGKVARYCRWH